MAVLLIIIDWKNDFSSISVGEKYCYLLIASASQPVNAANRNAQATGQVERCERKRVGRSILLMRLCIFRCAVVWVHKFVFCRIALLLQHVNIFYLHLEFPLTKRDEDFERTRIKIRKKK